MNVSAINWQRWTPLLVLTALIIFFAIANPNFFALRNFARIAMVSAPGLMVAVGVTFIIIMGSIDLSMEGTVAVCASVFAVILLALGGEIAGSGFIAIPLALLVGAVVGGINGLVHVKLRIPSFMASLSIGFVGLGVALLLTGGERLRISDSLFRGLVTERWFGFPVMVYVALIGLLVGWFIQTRTAIGRHFYAIGGGEELARASGLNVERIRILGFVIAGVFFGLGALLSVGRLGIAEAFSGSGMMFASITAVVVGGTALWGGSGGVWHTLTGVLIVNVINNGMVVMGLPRYLQDGVLGVLVIAAVVLSTNRKLVSFVK